MATVTQTLESSNAEGKPIKLAVAYDDKIHNSSKYAAYLPVYDTTTKFPPTELFDFKDRVFRDQDFKDIGPEKQKEFGQYFGRLHVHPTGAHVKDHIEFHSIYLGKDNLYRLGHPGITLLTLLEVPETGGDTGWTSQAAAYDRLSEPLKAFLEGLRAEHSGFQQAENARRDGHFVRREPVKRNHPIVRVHPVTKQKVLFVNPGFTRRIVGLKDEESDAILQLLYKHIAQSQDIQARVKWDDRTVALWDNRVTAHTAISDYDVSDEGEGLRQGFRITTLAEVPEGVSGLKSEWD
ncbi:TfdA family Taurine catabolism dioxygenase TauD [Diaporthe eres]|nr:TfdA family Taurine catabolism dioxygenase TauD [Diaporthe eres]